MINKFISSNSYILLISKYRFTFIYDNISPFPQFLDLIQKYILGLDNILYTFLFVIFRRIREPFRNFRFAPATFTY